MQGTKRKKLADHIKIVTLSPSCGICGKSTNSKFLKRWNDIDACPLCLTEVTADYDFAAAYEKL